uniref:Uncharacterized protein n=1 Tax=Daphnia galeata TaxID=27404 RepID=A0A8J2WET2_9CRUS|nr:unnamed protein product [Daphnia galeata]
MKTEFSIFLLIMRNFKRKNGPLTECQAKEIVMKKTVALESELAAYLIVAKRLNHGLTPADTTKRAFFPPEKIFNCEETNNPTVVDPQNIVAQKGAKAVASSTSGEQGINVNILAFVNAAGDAFLGVFI